MAEVIIWPSPSHSGLYQVSTMTGATDAGWIRRTCHLVPGSRRISRGSKLVFVIGSTLFYTHPNFLTSVMFLPLQNSHRHLAILLLGRDRFNNNMIIIFGPQIFHADNISFRHNHAEYKDDILFWQALAQLKDNMLWQDHVENKDNISFRQDHALSMKTTSHFYGNTLQSLKTPS
jgi:hypothetical protein